MQPTLKYHNTRVDPIDGKTQLSWRVHPDGLPTDVTNTPRLVERSKKVAAQEVALHRSRIFKIPEEINDYNIAMDWVLNNGGHVRFERELPRKDGEGWLIWTAWVELRGYVPTEHQLSALGLT